MHKKGGPGFCSMAASVARQPRSQLLILQGFSRWTPSHETAHAEFSLRWRGFLTLSHTTFPLPTLSPSLALFFFLCPLMYTHTHMHTHLHTNTLAAEANSSVRCCFFVSSSTLGLNHNNHWHLQRVSLLIDLTSLTHHFPTATQQSVFEVSPRRLAPTLRLIFSSKSPWTHELDFVFGPPYDAVSDSTW